MRSTMPFILPASSFIRFTTGSASFKIPSTSFCFSVPAPVPFLSALAAAVFSISAILEFRMFISPPKSTFARTVSTIRTASALVSGWTESGCSSIFSAFASRSSFRSSFRRRHLLYSHGKEVDDPAADQWISFPDIPGRLFRYTFCRVLCKKRTSCGIYYQRAYLRIATRRI